MDGLLQDFAERILISFDFCGATEQEIFGHKVTNSWSKNTLTVAIDEVISITINYADL